mmetsp:Transcript_5448/g.19530  ORF Transcript_5448/g.19530 Transcript_5448/m.19530 type:complete len:239 (-) Transcript_5448:1093-1809(-)
MSEAAAARARAVLARQLTPLTTDWQDNNCWVESGSFTDDRAAYDAGIAGTVTMDMRATPTNDYYASGTCMKTLLPTYGDLDVVTIEFAKGENDGDPEGEMNLVLFDVGEPEGPWHYQGLKMGITRDGYIPEPVQIYVPPGEALRIMVQQNTYDTTGETSHWTMAITSGTTEPEPEPEPSTCVPPTDFAPVPGMVFINGAMHHACDGACAGGADVIIGGQEYELVGHDTGLAAECDAVA